VIGQIVIAGQAQHRHRRCAEHLAHPAITVGVVLHQVAGQQDAVGAMAATLSVRDGRLQRGQRGHATQAAVRFTEQVQVGKLNETDRLHRATSTRYIMGRQNSYRDRSNRGPVKR
jgi:hypothetical protein